MLRKSPACADFLRFLNFDMTSDSSLVSLARSTLMCWMSSMSVESTGSSLLTESSCRRPEIRLKTALKLLMLSAKRTLEARPRICTTWLDPASAAALPMSRNWQISFSRSFTFITSSYLGESA